MVCLILSVRNPTTLYGSWEAAISPNVPIRTGWYKNVQAGTKLYKLVPICTGWYGFVPKRTGNLWFNVLFILMLDVFGIVNVRFFEARIPNLETRNNIE